MQAAILAKKARLNVVKAARNVGSVHFGGSFSVMEILAAYYLPVASGAASFADFIEHNSLILSKGHCGLAVYAMLNVLGVVSDETLASYCKDGGAFMGHIKRDEALGIGWSTGSLGHGLSISIGLAGAARYLQENKRITCIVGDGEMHEGSNWEALLHLSHDGAFPLTIILDNNQYLSLGATRDIRPIEPVEAKIRDFGIHCLSLDGHDVAALVHALGEAGKRQSVTFINANTLKGQGVSFTAGVTEWHAKRANEEQLVNMEEELGEGL